MQVLLVGASKALLPHRLSISKQWRQRAADPATCTLWGVSQDTSEVDIKIRIKIKVKIIKIKIKINSIEIEVCEINGPHAIG